MFSDESFKKLTDLLKVHEGLPKKYLPYYDTKKIMTWGYGRNLEADGFRETEIPFVLALFEFMLANDLEDRISFLNDKYYWFSDLSDCRQVALINLSFCVGKNGFTKFKKMIAALERKDYKRASDEILDSLFAKQTGNRALDLAFMIREDKWSVNVVVQR